MTSNGPSVCIVATVRVDYRTDDANIDTGGLCTRLNVQCVYREPLPTK